MACSYSGDCFQYRGDIYCRVTCRPQTYTQVGLLMNETLHGPRPLFGVRTDRASPDWYYFTYSDTDPPLRLPIIAKKRKCTKRPRGCEELNEGDMVEVQGYEGKLFKVTLF